MTDHKRKKPAKQWARNTEGIRTRAEEKARDTRLRVRAALARLTGPDATQDVAVNFQTVAQAANCSPSWLYGHKEVREEIMRLRQEQEHKRKGAVVIPLPERASDASKTRMIAELKKTMERLRTENEELKRQVKALSAQLYERL
jgi:hypothetical protein